MDCLFGFASQIFSYSFSGAGAVENFTADSILNFSGRTPASVPGSYCIRNEVSVVHSRIPNNVFPV